MKILVFSWRDPRHPLAGGAEQVMHEHMKGWIKAGHKVTLFSSNFKNSPVEEAIDGIDIVRRGYQYLGVQASGFLYYLRHGKEYDLVIDQFHGIPFLTPLYVTKPKLAVIQETAREVWFLNPLPFPLNLIIGLMGYLGERFIFLLYKNIIFMTGSESAKKEVIKMGIAEDHIVVVPHGVLTAKPKSLINKEIRPTVTYLGVLSKDKGIEDALACFKILSKDKTFQFWVMGRVETGEYNDRIKKQVRDLGLEDRVKFWGFVNQRQKFDLLSRSHILINPSVREGWGLVNIEANSVGTPVVAYSSPGLCDSVKNEISGVLCSENTPAILASNVTSLIQDSKKYTKLQKGALAWSKNFSWDKSIAMSLKLIPTL